MNILQCVIDAISPAAPVCPRNIIRAAGYSPMIQAQAIARYDRHVGRGADAQDALHQVMAWADSREDAA